MSTHSVRAEVLSSRELFELVNAPPMPDFHVRRHGDTWTIQPLTHEGRLYALELPLENCTALGDRLLVDGLPALVSFLDDLFDAGLRCV